MSHAEVKHPFKLLPRYPGLRPNDEAIWDDFIQKNPSAFDHVFYNVHVGDPSSDEGHKKVMLSNGSFEVSQWCVDVVAFANDVPHIIEIKPEAGASAIGQVLAYKTLLIQEGRISEPCVPVILTNTISPITEQAALRLGIILMVP